MIVGRGGTTAIFDLLAAHGLARTAGLQRTIKEAELLVLRHEVAVRREALGTEGGVRPSRWAVAAAWLELSAV